MSSAPVPVAPPRRGRAILLSLLALAVTALLMPVTATAAVDHGSWTGSIHVHEEGLDLFVGESGSYRLDADFAVAGDVGASGSLLIDALVSATYGATRPSFGPKGEEISCTSTGVATNQPTTIDFSNARPGFGFDPTEGVSYLAPSLALVVTETCPSVTGGARGTFQRNRGYGIYDRLELPRSGPRGPQILSGRRLHWQGSQFIPATTEVYGAPNVTWTYDLTYSPGESGCRLAAKSPQRIKSGSLKVSILGREVGCHAKLVSVALKIDGKSRYKSKESKTRLIRPNKPWKIDLAYGALKSQVLGNALRQGKAVTAEIRVEIDGIPRTQTVRLQG